MHRHLQIAALSLALLAGASAAANATNYNEGADGDLSDLSGAPTKIGVLTLGENYIVGSTIPSGDPIPGGHGALANQDNDFFTFTVASGSQLSAFDILGDTSIEWRAIASSSESTQGDDSRRGSGQSDAGRPPGLYTPGDAADWERRPPRSRRVRASRAFPRCATHFTGALGAGDLHGVAGGRRLARCPTILICTSRAAPEPATWSLMIGGSGLDGRQASAGRRQPIGAALS